VRITWQGEPVGYVLVEWIGLVESELCEDHHKELFTIDSASIIHEYIEKGDPEFRNVTQMRFEIMNGFFRYEARDNSGGVVKSFMTALSYIHTIETRKDEPSREPGMPMHKLSKEEKRKAR
jgi:hypothetical protein